MILPDDCAVIIYMIAVSMGYSLMMLAHLYLKDDRSNGCMGIAAMVWGGIMIIAGLLYVVM